MGDGIRQVPHAVMHRTCDRVGPSRGSQSRVRYGTIWSLEGGATPISLEIPRTYTARSGVMYSAKVMVRAGVIEVG